MKYFADLHLHSHFARATAKTLDLEHMHQAAQLKGITLVGTGDFTHPGWLADIREKLVPAEPGLFKLKKDIAAPFDREIPESCRNPVRFILQCEISSIYKKEGKVRKNHNLVYFSDIAGVTAFNARLDHIGNLASDGRPILGLDCERLLEIVLETSRDAFLVPAHIWTPWFSMFGAKSGFDSIQECFGSLAGHIFAAETGLSSDPPMNWRVADLDNVTLVSSSDAHSPMYMGRNASVFTTDLSYAAVRQALETGDLEKYRGTVDMYPQEGKYHFDGHRKCNVCLNPGEAMASSGLCPQCRKPLTPGVLNRVQQLATRPEGYLPDTRQGYQSIVPLVDLLSEICGVGPKTKKVAACYNKALAILGPELAILLEKSRDEIEKAGIPLLAEAVARMRKGAVKISPGFDGEYGRVSIFHHGEKEKLLGEPELFPVHGKPASVKKPPARRKPSRKKESGRAALASSAGEASPALFEVTLNHEQGRALAVADRPLIIEAGPGTGKTRTIIEKIKHLIADKGVDPGAILALTFTNRAAGEVKERIQKAVPGAGTEVAASTFHAFCLAVLKNHGDGQFSVADETVRKELLKQACLNVGYGTSRANPAFDRLDQIMARAKQQCLSLEDDLGDLAGPEEAAVLKRVWAEYNRLMASLNLVDFEDLLVMVLTLIKRDGRLLQEMQQRFSHIFVDEYQDINLGQYRLVRLLAEKGKGLTVIGDPDQSIYGFRGSDNRYFRKFMDDYPDAVKIVLTWNYRSTQTILDASFQMITRAAKNGDKEKLSSRAGGRARVEILEAASDRAEAAVVGKKIENLVGGISLFSMDAGTADHGSGRGYSFSDFAVLYRTRKQALLFARAFEQAGIPFQTADRENLFAHQGIKELMALVRIAVQRWTVFDLEILLDHMEAGAGNKTKEKLRQWFYTLDRPAGRGPSALLAQTPLTDIRSHIRKNISLACAELERLGLAVQGRQPEEALEILAGKSGITGVILQSETGAAAYNRLLLHAQGCTGGLTAFLDSLALDRDTESIEPDAEKVSLMTIHGAKGLEFPVVFVTGCEQGLLPYAGKGKGGDDVDEERRLFYVAMTRAKDLLCLSYAKKRRVFGAVKKCVKSRFLSDIEEQLKAYEARSGRFKNKQPKAKQLELF